MSQGYTLDQICERLRSTKFRWNCERDLQDGIDQVLAGMGLTYTREHRLTKTDIVDFLIDGPDGAGLGIEVKIKGTVMDLLRQLGRYAQSAEVGSLLVVTGRVQLTGIKNNIGGKTVRVVSLLGSIL